MPRRLVNLVFGSSVTAKYKTNLIWLNRIDQVERIPNVLLSSFYLF